jgi:hypothetical protein
MVKPYIMLASSILLTSSCTTQPLNPNKDSTVRTIIVDVISPILMVLMAGNEEGLGQRILGRNTANLSRIKAVTG